MKMCVCICIYEYIYMYIYLLVVLTHALMGLLFYVSMIYFGVLGYSQKESY